MTVTRIAALAGAIATAAVLALSAPAQAATAYDANGIYADSNGNLNYQVHIPPQQSTGAKLPVVVALHGCGMTGAGLNSMKDLTAFNTLADQQGFIVVYPSQTFARNVTLCWNAFDPADQQRGLGEPELIDGITQHVISTYDADPKRVHVVGASSGAGMAVILGVTYPDVFASVGSMAGGEYGIQELNTSDPNDPTKPSPTDTAQQAFAQMGPRARQVPLLVGQGDADTTVNPAFADRLVAQYAAIDNLVTTGQVTGPMHATPDTTENVSPAGKQSYTHTTYVPTTGGPALIEKYLVHGMGHAWPGNGSGLFADTSGPDLSQIFWNFARTKTLG